jgi:adenosylmethionine-8-amino-7-oxononanoate aminotransferase
VSALWPHFGKLSTDLVTMARGEGAYLWDDRGNRYLDGLAGLFVVQAGHGRRELAAAGAAQAEQLAFFPLWGFAHPAAVALAERLTSLAPAGLGRVFFTSGGSEAVESAWKLARQHFVLTGEPSRYKVIARRSAYHGTTLGALAINGLDALKAPFLPMLNTDAVLHTPTTHGQTAAIADDIERLIVEAGPETVAAVFLEPVQNAGGCYVPPDGYWPRVREICDRHGVLLVSDEVICAFGRLGEWFGAGRLDYRPDMITFAKGVTSGYSPLGGVLVADRVAEPFTAEGASFTHGITFGGHPVSCAVALANLDLMEAEDLPGRVRKLEGDFRAALDTLADLPMVVEVRGMGYFYGIELAVAPEHQDWLIRGYLPGRMLEAGLYCRADDRVDPVIQLSPPLVVGPEEFDLMASTLREVLLDAQRELARR